MKKVIMKYEQGGSKIISNVINDAVINGVHYVLVVNTDIGIATTYKIVDGFFAGEKNSQSCEIVEF